MMPGLEFGLAYTRLDAVDARGQEEARRPRNAGRADVNYTFDRGRGTVNVAAIYNGSMRDDTLVWPTFLAGSVRLDNYVLLNVGASYKVQQGVEVFGRVENALDRRYEEVYGFNSAPIAAYAGVRITLEDKSGLLAPAR